MIQVTGRCSGVLDTQKKHRTSCKHPSLHVKREGMDFFLQKSDSFTEPMCMLFTCSLLWMYLLPFRSISSAMSNSAVDDIHTITAELAGDSLDLISDDKPEEQSMEELEEKDDYVKDIEVLHGLKTFIFSCNLNDERQSRFIPEFCDLPNEIVLKIW